MRLPALLFTLIASLAAQSFVVGQPAKVSSAEPLTLDVAVAEALEKNLELIAARAGITVAPANLITAGLRPYPVISVGGDHLFWARASTTRTARAAEYSARVDFLMERGGKRAWRIELVQEERAIAKAEVLDRVHALNLEVQKRSSLCSSRRHLTLARENAASLDQIANLIAACACKSPRSTGV